jgi:hypothetical protein
MLAWDARPWLDSIGAPTLVTVGLGRIVTLY